MLRPPRQLWRTAACLVAGLQQLACGILTPPVARTVDGVTTDGRFIEPDAYALYAVAALREARGQYREALDLYERARDIDDDGPELATRIGAVACQLQDKARADRAFAAAKRADPGYGPLWFELASCSKARGDLADAESAARRAVELDPERYEASLLAAQLMELRGDHAGAWQMRDALVTHAPRSLLVQRGVLEAARRGADKQRVERAQAAVAALTHPSEAEAPRSGVPYALASLARGDVAEARREARRVLSADPGNGDALVLALWTANLQQDHADFASLLARADEPGRPVSPELLGMLQALVAQRVSAQAGQLLKPNP